MKTKSLLSIVSLVGALLLIWCLSPSSAQIRGPVLAPPLPPIHVEPPIHVDTPSIIYTPPPPPAERTPVHPHPPTPAPPPGPDYPPDLIPQSGSLALTPALRYRTGCLAKLHPLNSLLTC